MKVLTGWLLLCAIAGAQQRAVHTDLGALAGVPSHDPAVTAFLGVPYAAPPVGELRWRLPQRAAAWAGVRKADHFSASCIQHMNGARLPWTAEFMPPPGTSEDCLYLNVWTSNVASAKPMPVVVWVHGGGFTQGSASAAIINGEQIAKQGIVFVSINYRLGILGFFAHPELTAESPHHSSGNYGLMDMVAALEWVQRNIRAFGGDPAKVTIAGQSAGASAMEFLAAMPSAKGLFRGEIIESGAQVKGPTANSAAEQEKLGVTMATVANAPSLKELRALPAERVLALGGKAHTKFVPDIDGYVVPDKVMSVLAAGRQNDVPTMNGLVLEEGSSHPDYGKLSAAQFTQNVRDHFRSNPEDALRLYPADTPEHLAASQKAFDSDRRLVSEYLWALERGKTAKTPVFLYHFTHPIPWPEHPEFGVFHCTEMPYWMGNLKLLDRPYTEADFQLSAMTMAYWVNFIRTQDPNGPGLPAWQAATSEARQVMDLGDHSAMRPLLPPEKLSLWMGAYWHTSAKK